MIQISPLAILICASQKYRNDMSPIELYNITRGRWKVSSSKAKKAKYAFSVYEEIILEVYEILSWYEGGATFSNRYDEGLSQHIRVNWQY